MTQRGGSDQISANAKMISAKLKDQGWDVDVRLSPRRKKTISARQEGQGFVLLAPSTLGGERVVAMAQELFEKIEKKSGRGGDHVASDDDLAELARQLNERYLEGKASWESIRWVSNMSTRWGSCSIDTGRIRISDRLQHVPEYVLDSVVIHELVHTWIPNHGEHFWHWAQKAPRLEKARGYLEAYQRWG